MIILTPVIKITGVMIMMIIIIIIIIILPLVLRSQGSLKIA